MSEKKTAEELYALLQDCPEPCVLGWRHKASGRLYSVLGRCIIEATCLPAVLYHATPSEGVVWVRPLGEWLEKFERVT